MYQINDPPPPPFMGALAPPEFPNKSAVNPFKVSAPPETPLLYPIFDWPEGLRPELGNPIGLPVGALCI